MVISRKNIIIKAELAQMTKENQNETKVTSNDTEDIWHDKQTLYKDHINEVLQKWKQIDDQIWAKIICFERNQRVAKAYLRAPLVNINSSTIGFDGHKIGLSGFKGCFFDEKINLVKNRIGKGIDLCIEENGNLSLRKVNGKCEIIVRPYDSSFNALPDQLLLSNGRINCNSENSSSVIFDLHKFKCNIFKELTISHNNGYKADRKKLENQCISALIFIRESSTKDSLQNPVWLLLINIVALDFLHSKSIDIFFNKSFKSPIQIINRTQYYLLDENVLKNNLLTKKNQQNFIDHQSNEKKEILQLPPPRSNSTDSSVIKKRSKNNNESISQQTNSQESNKSSSKTELKQITKPSSNVTNTKVIFNKSSNEFKSAIEKQVSTNESKIILNKDKKHSLEIVNKPSKEEKFNKEVIKEIKTKKLCKESNLIKELNRGLKNVTEELKIEKNEESKEKNKEIKDSNKEKLKTVQDLNKERLIEEGIIRNNFKLVEKKVIDNKIQNRSSRYNYNKKSVNAYKNGFTYLDKNSQKLFNKLYTQNSFDSGFYSPSSTDSYNLSSTSGSCNALIYTTKNLESNKDEQINYFEKKNLSAIKKNSRNLPRNIACFNGAGFSYWSNNHRKYYSTEILSDWN